MSSGADLILLAAIFLFVLAAAQVLLSTRKYIVFGFILPALFLILGGYNLYKSLFVYNPYPNMAEGMFMTLGIIGFGISSVMLIICRIIMKYRLKGDE